MQANANSALAQLAAQNPLALFMLAQAQLNQQNQSNQQGQHK